MALSKTLRFAILSRDGFKCRYCGRKPPEVELHVDHVQPKSLGGKDKESNLVAACRDCNGGKSDALVEDAAWLQRLREVSTHSRGLFSAEFYCQNHDCSCREITIRFKDYDSTLVDTIKAKGKARCPACHKHMKMHWALSSEELDKRSESRARESVNLQRYLRDHGNPICCPLSAMIDDSLPA